MCSSAASDLFPTPQKWSEEPKGKDGNKDADLLENGLEDTGRGKGKLGKSERVAWRYIHYQT